MKLTPEVLASLRTLLVADDTNLTKIQDRVQGWCIVIARSDNAADDLATLYEVMKEASTMAKMKAAFAKELGTAKR